MPKKGKVAAERMKIEIVTGGGRKDITVPESFFPAWEGMKLGGEILTKRGTWFGLREEEGQTDLLLKKKRKNSRRGKEKKWVFSPCLKTTSWGGKEERRAQEGERV